ncbi:unnamed protein product [Dovyalis caffra]|uniref:SHSP domain-containing protein n=1 Tax=Dovyalis caffra TaxID=77055 RepID=A0AAV1SDX8_9ROSI|nr:unnamed protein product [Dovyalis caffra]
MPRLKSGDIKFKWRMTICSVISGERKHGEEKERAKYNANIDAISAVREDGFFTITIEKLPPPESEKPKNIKVNIT